MQGLTCLHCRQPAAARTDFYVSITKAGVRSFLIVVSVSSCLTKLSLVYLTNQETSSG